MTPLLVGRDGPLRRIDALLTQGEAGRGGAVVLEGIPGVGKTALVRHAVQVAEDRGFDVRLATGVPIETDLPFAGLSSLLASELHRGDLATHAPALAAAIGHHRLASPPSSLTVAAEVLDLLSTHGHDRPILLALDDAQWTDVSTLVVLGHVARHSVADRVAVLIAQRPSADHQSADHQLARGPFEAAENDTGQARRRALAAVETLAIETLSHADTMTALLAAGCPSDRAERWAPRCGGLPLAIAEVGRRSAVLDPDPTEIARLLPDAYVERISALPAHVSFGLLCAAVCSDTSILRQLNRPGLMASLRDAEMAGLVSFIVGVQSQEEHVVFRHPLLRAAALAGASRAEERAVHAAVAGICVAAGLLDRAAVHLVLAADGPDDEAADAIAALGRRAHSRGALLESANALMRAAALTTRSEQKAPLLTRAADALFDDGDVSAAFRVVEQAISSAPDPRDDADARALKARMSIWVLSPKDAVRGLVQVADSMRTLDPARSAAALATASGIGYLDGDLGGAIDRGREAERMAVAIGDMVIAAGASATIAFNTFMAAEWEESERRLSPLEPLMRALLDQRSWAGIHLAEIFGITWICSERWDDADTLIRHVLHTTRAMGARQTVASTTLLLASLSWRRGRWDEAYALVMPLLDATDFPLVTLAWVRIQIAQLLACLGQVDATRELLALGMPVLLKTDVPLIAAVGYAAQGHLEFSLGHDELALALFDHVAELTDRVGVLEPEYLPWQGDYLDVLVRLGRRAEARERLRVLSKLGDGGSRRWVKGVVARTNAQLADEAVVADAYFDDALSCFDGLGMPFEVARTLLLRGRPEDRADARRLFLRLGAVVWSERATEVDAQAPRASVEPPLPAALSDDGPRVLEMLTPQERSVSLAVVSGRTNREIAAEVHLSAKTVDHYLQRAYRRLGVKNRTELATTVALALAAPRRPEN